MDVLSARRLVATGAGACIYWASLAIITHRSGGGGRLIFRVTSGALLAAALMLPVRVTVDYLDGVAGDAATISESTRWVLVWAGYFGAWLLAYLLWKSGHEANSPIPPPSEALQRGLGLRSRVLPLMLRSLVNKALRPLELKVVPRHHDLLLYQHAYSGGFEEYRREQIKWNRAKIDRVWADRDTLTVIAADIRSKKIAGRGLCHGARNGFEVQWFADALDCHVLGTDISETADQFEKMVIQDFHEPRPEWIGKWDFIYTNSLDHAFSPRKALDTWADQLTPKGRMYIEQTMEHSPAGASEMDPFGVHPILFPYLVFEWGKGKYSLADILHVDVDKRKGHVWVFVLEREPPEASKSAKKS